MKILLYGNSYIAEVCSEKLRHQNASLGWNVVGFVPCKSEPTIPGIMSPLEEVSENVPHDIKLSIQYDRRIKTDDRPAYNVHTGLLPHWGGCDILYHTLQEGAKHQGITFHVMTDRLDSGPIVAQFIYPVLPNDDIKSLYLRLAKICPDFVVQSLRLAQDLIGWHKVNQCASFRPRMYNRGEIHPDDREMYQETPQQIRRLLGRLGR